MRWQLLPQRLTPNRISNPWRKVQLGSKKIDSADAVVAHRYWLIEGFHIRLRDERLDGEWLATWIEALLVEA